MALNSSSSLEEIQAAYLDNASYAESASVEKALAFQTACLMLLLKLPRTASHGPANVALNTDLIRQELDRCREWLASHGEEDAVRHFSFRQFRE